MKYSKHRILESGHIELREVMEDGTFHRSVIAPNQPLEKYNDIIEADSDYAKYRTQATADAYEAQLIADEPTEEERLEQWRQSANVELWKLKAILDSQGLLDSVELAVQGFPKAVQLAWEYSPDVQRLSPAVIGLAETLELNETELDEIFTEAKKLRL
jgi:hypothetical protein